MRVLAIVPSLYDTSPGQRFRIEQWEPLLREGGVEITYAPFETDELRRVLYQRGNVLSKVGAVSRGMARRRRELDDLKGFDLVYIFREAALLGPPWFERKIARSGVPVIFDFDDAVFFSYKSPSNGYLSYLKFPAKIAEICHLVDHVMAGNEFLADYARPHSDRVTIVPTTIDTEKYRVIEKSNDPGILTIGWSGSFSTIQHLDTIREVLQELAATEKFKLRVIGTPAYDLPGIDVEALAWRSESELEDLRTIDIGLMPLPDDNWSKGKCGLKALQYMALGIPTVCSPVGVNSTIIQDGESGFLADTAQDWIAKIKRLLHSPELRSEFGRKGRETVEEAYSAKAVAPRVLEIFKSTVRQRP
ncbi:MAG: glycosyltransferase family 4 protein [Pyrinomonadaceae bacterium]